jgi:hypothetical protein
MPINSESRKGDTSLSRDVPMAVASHGVLHIAIWRSGCARGSILARLIDCFRPLPFALRFCLSRVRDD